MTGSSSQRPPRRSSNPRNTSNNNGGAGGHGRPPPRQHKEHTQRRAPPAAPAGPTIVAIADSGDDRAWLCGWICVIPETDEGLFVFARNGRKKFWDGFGCRGAEPEGPPPFSPETLRSAADANRERAAQALLFQSRGVAARTIGEARRMIREGYVEIVNGATVCTVGLRKLWTPHDVAALERLREDEVRAAREHDRPCVWVASSLEFIMLDEFARRGKIDPEDLAKNLWEKTDDDGDQTADDGELTDPPEHPPLGALEHVRLADRLDVFSAMDIAEGVRGVRLHAVAAASICAGAHHR